MAEWQTIDTAPEGMPVLVYWPPDKMWRGFQGVAMLSGGMWHDPDDDEDDFKTPTHWMPLPSPPIAAAPKLAGEE